MFDRKALFDKIRDIKGDKLTQSDVNAINAILDPVQPAPSPTSLAPHSRLKPSTILAAQASERKWGVPASIVLGQFALESAWGTKTSGDFNYFGIKARDGEPFKVVRTREVINGKPQMMDLKFRSYASEEEAFDAHGKLLATGRYMQKAMAALPNLRRFANELGGGTAKDPRYATDPNYGAALFNVMSKSGLLQYDLGSYTS